MAIEPHAPASSRRRRCVDDDVGAEFVAYRASGDRRLRNELVERHRWLAHNIARGYADRNEPLEDLEQVALLVLLRAVERFAPDNGTPFTAFATVTIRGELRRHFRDRTWTVHVPRPAKDLEQRLKPAVETLTHQLGRAPRPAEVAAHLHATIDHVLEAMQAGGVYRTRELTETAVAVAATEDPADTATDRVAIQALLDTLGPRERRIIELRFFQGCSQHVIARRVGISQVQVSRLLKRTLAQLRLHHERPLDAAS